MTTQASMADVAYTDDEIETEWRWFGVMLSFLQCATAVQLAIALYLIGSWLAGEV
jgi:hypothetical protein